MYALLVTFRPEASEQEIMSGIGPIVKRLVETTPGLIMKTYVAEGADTWGGFYLFASKADADGFLKGECYGWLSSSELVSNLQVRHFDIEDEPSIAFGTPTVPLSQAQAA